MICVEVGQPRFIKKRFDSPYGLSFMAHVFAERVDVGSRVGNAVAVSDVVGVGRVVSVGITAAEFCAGVAESKAVGILIVAASDDASCSAMLPPTAVGNANAGGTVATIPSDTAVRDRSDAILDAIAPNIPMRSTNSIRIAAILVRSSKHRKHTGCHEGTIRAQRGQVLRTIMNRLGFSCFECPRPHDQMIAHRKAAVFKSARSLSEAIPIVVL